MTRLRANVALANSLLFVAPVAWASSEVSEPETSSSESVQSEELDDLEERARRLDAQERRLLEMEQRYRALLDGQTAKDDDEADDGSIFDLPEATPAEVIDNAPTSGFGRGEEFTDPNFAKSVPLFGSDFRFSYGGYAKTDVIHDFSGTGNKQEFVLNTIPVAGDPQSGSYSHLQMSETRVHMEVRDMSQEPDMRSRVFVEWDFFDETNPSSLRLRHAYFEYGNLLAGRTWTTLTELRQLPLMLDFASGDSLYGGRTEQIRWQQDIDDELSWAIALESFNDGAILNAGSAPGEARSDFPRLVGRMTSEFERGVLTVGGALSQNRWDRGGMGGNAVSTGWSVMLGGRLYVDEARKDFLGFGASFDQGNPSSIITFANAGVPNAVLTTTGDLESVPAWNLNFGYHREWIESWSSNFHIAYARIGRVDELPAETIRTGSSFHANVMKQVTNNVTVGLEYMHGYRELLNDMDGRADRVQFSLFYYF